MLAGVVDVHDLRCPGLGGAAFQIRAVAEDGELADVVRPAADALCLHETGEHVRGSKAAMWLEVPGSLTGYPLLSGSSSGSWSPGSLEVYTFPDYRSCLQSPSTPIHVAHPVVVLC